MVERKTIPYQEVLEQQLKESPEFKAEHDKQNPVFELITALIKARQNAGLTRKQVAERMKSSQSVVTRFETDFCFNPSFELAQRYAKALGRELRLVPKDD